MPETRRRFDPEFRAGAVRIVIETGKPIAQVARDLGIHAGKLGNWVAAVRSDDGQGALDADERAELIRLRHRCAEPGDGARHALTIRGRVGERGENVTLAQFVASQRTDHGIPHAAACRALGVAESWLCRWRNGPPSVIEARRADLDEAVKRCLDDSEGTYGSPRVLAQVPSEGRAVSRKPVEASMARQGLAARPSKRRRSRRADSDTAAQDLIGRDFTAQGPDRRWVGDFTEIPTGQGKAHFAAATCRYARMCIWLQASPSPLSGSSPCSQAAGSRPHGSAERMVPTFSPRRNGLTRPRALA